METNAEHVLPVPMADSETKLLEKLLHDTRRANFYLSINVSLYALFALSLVRFVLTFLPGPSSTYAFLFLSLVVIGISLLFIHRRWWNPVTLGQYIDRTMERDNLIRSACTAMGRKERLGFCDLNVKKAYESACQFRVPPPWPILAFQVAGGWVLRNKLLLYKYLFPGVLLALLLLWLYLLMSLESKPKQAKRTESYTTPTAEAGKPEQKGKSSADRAREGQPKMNAASSKTGSTLPNEKSNQATDEPSIRQAKDQLRDNVAALRKKVEALKKGPLNKKESAPASESKGEATRALEELDKSLKKLEDMSFTPEEIAEAERTLGQLMKDNKAGKLGPSDQDQKSIERGLEETMRSLQAMKNANSSYDKGAGTMTTSHAMTGAAPPSDQNKRSIYMPDMPKTDEGRGISSAKAARGRGHVNASPAQMDPDEVLPPGRPPREYDKFLKGH